MKTKNYLFEKLMKKSIFISIVTAGIGLSTYQSNAQNQMCADSENYGIQAYDANTLSYDNIVSGFHQTATTNINGVMQVWGQHSHPSGDSSFLTPTAVNKGNFPQITGKPLKIGIGSRTEGVQYILLTDDNKLWLWGSRSGLNHSGAVVANALTSTQIGNWRKYPFQQVIPHNNSGRSLPNGVNATDIKMLFVTWGTIAITTCDGAVWVLSQNDHIAQGNPATEWVRIHKADSAEEKGDPLSNVVATRGSPFALMALTADGKVYTWGKETRLGNGTAPSNRNYAGEMSLPNNANGTVKMIGATSYDKNSQSSGTAPVLDNGKHSYYILYQTAGENYGELWALGNNEKKQLGNWSTSSSNSWVQPRYDSASGPVMDDIVWISPQEHDMVYPFINVINQEQYLFNWGAEAFQALGRGTHNVSTGSSGVDPGKPSNWSEGSNEDIMGVESGGHTTMIIRKCSSTYGYLGHRVRGSMGDGEYENMDGVAEVLFNTYPLQLSGIPTIDATLEANRGGPYCKNIPIQLNYAPLGGTFGFYNNEDKGATISQTGELDPSNIDFNGASSVFLRITYVLPQGEECAGSMIQYLIEIEDCIQTTLGINATVWHDKDGNAKQEGAESGLSNDMWANLTNPDGFVIGYAKVESDGTFTIQINNLLIGDSGDYSVVLTNNKADIGDLVNIGDTPVNGYVYTGTNKGWDGSSYKDVESSNNSGKIILGDLSGYYNGAADAVYVDEANFGMQFPPVADNKLFEVPNNAFSTSPGEGYPDVLDFRAIPMSSAALTGYTYGGDLTGSDYEDCPNAETCNSNSNATFSIETIQSNTMLYYDFGDSVGIAEIDVSGGAVIIEGFDLEKMMIYGENGAGNAGNELGFTYSLIDKAGAKSEPAVYTIETNTPLPIKLASFEVYKKQATALLNWSTSMEKENAGFEVQRSVDGTNWEVIAYVNSKAENGNSAKELLYDFVDEKPARGLNYYRLKQEDFDGVFEYSKVRTVRFDNSNSAIKVYPNPAEDYIILEGITTSVKTVQIANVVGQVVKEVKSPTTNSMQIDIIQLQAGIYTIHIVQKDGSTQIEKVIIK